MSSKFEMQECLTVDQANPWSTHTLYSHLEEFQNFLEYLSPSLSYRRVLSKKKREKEKSKELLRKIPHTLRRPKGGVLSFSWLTKVGSPHKHTQLQKFKQFYHFGSVKIWKPQRLRFKIPQEIKDSWKLRRMKFERDLKANKMKKEIIVRRVQSEKEI